MRLQSEPVGKSSCFSCEHGHDDSPLPQGVLVVISGILTRAGLILGWMDIRPGWLQTTAFAIATLAGGLLVFPAAWKAFLAKRLDMNVFIPGTSASSMPLSPSHCTC